MEIKEFFQLASQKGITNIQITEKHTINSDVELVNDKIESYNDSDENNYSIKAEYNQKTVKAETNYLSEEIIDLLITKAVETDSSYKDEYLPKRKKQTPNEPPNIFIAKEIETIKSNKKYLKKYPLLKNINSYYTETYQNIRIMNSNGVDISTDSHLYSFIVEAIVENEGEVISFDQKVLTTNKEDIDFSKFTREVIEKAILQSKRVKLETNKYDIVLDSTVAGKIISHFATVLSATSIRNKVSFLEKSLNKKIFSNNFTIIEDPTNKDYTGYRLFDDEGTPTKKKTIIENGTIKTFLYNIKEAKIKKISSTGNGYTGIETRNMYLLPGNKSEEDIIKEVKDGILITDYMGSMGTSINSVNGSISIQIFGFRIKDGKIVSGIEPAIMTTTFTECFSNIKEIGKELKFTNTHSASPTLLIENISIAS